MAKAASVQVVHGAEWRQRAEDQQRTAQAISAPRGTILDRNGTPLARTRETWEVGVATDQLEDREATRSALRRVLGISASTAARVTAGAKEWHVVPGRYEPAQREELHGLPGLHFTRVLQRSYLHGDLLASVLGSVRDGRGRGGIEEEFDHVLRGTAGRRVVRRDVNQRPIPGETAVVSPPVPGGEVRLTLDLDLQEIAYGALAEALDSTGAEGADILVADPGTGEVLAMVSLDSSGAPSRSAINTPYEPGSTLKPFTVAALLQNGSATLGDSVDTGRGWWRWNGRTLKDIGAHGVITLAEALRVSSNVGVAKAARALSPGQQYQNLRDFGFGSRTGVALPGEVPGRLRRPDQWSGQSAASLSIGYEINVTPLQMTMAYGALANGGRLMEPWLVREVRSPAGRVLDRRGPREVRSVVQPEVADRISRALVAVVEGGTGTGARLASFDVAGKSGTAREYLESEGAYASDSYFASFVGFFPADAPQLVVFVKLSGVPTYGGATAAPVIRTTLEAVLAAGTPHVDRTDLLRSVRSPVPGTMAPAEIRFAAGNRPPEPVRPTADGSASDPGVRASGPLPVPDVRGLPARAASRRLHAHGFRVAWEGSGTVDRMDPAPGTRRPPGDTIRLMAAGRGGGDP